MNKNRKFINALLVSTMMLSGLALDVSAADSTAVERLSGDNRTETSIAISKKANKKRKTVVLAGWDGEVDALTGTLLASNEEAPLLYVNEGTLEEVKTHIEELGAEEVLLLGGTRAISQKIEDDLKDSFDTVERVSGSDRFATAAEVAKRVNNGKADHVFITNNESLADALAAGPASGAEGMPILLTKTNSLNATTLQAIKDLGATKATIVGGDAVVSDAVKEELEAIDGLTVDRKSGSDKFITATAIAEEYFGESDRAIIANGDKNKSADALVGGYFGAELGAPILFTPAGSLNKTTQNYLGEKAVQAYVLGGTGIIEKDVVTAVESEVVVEELAVESVSAINSTQAEVTFSEPVKEVKPANFKVTDKDGNLAFVSKVELNNAKDVATLTFFDAFADKGEYTVETSDVEDAEGNVMETATNKFSYVKADVATVEFTSTTVAPKSDLKDAVKVTDELDRDVTGEVEIKFESSDESVVETDGTVKDVDGKSAIVVAKVGKVKSAKTTIKVSNAEAATFVGFDIYTDTNPQAGTTEAFEKLDADKVTTKASMDDKNATAGKEPKLALYYKDQYGKSMSAVKGGLKVTNVTPTVVIVENDGEIKPISAGEGYVKVKASDDLEHTIKIVVNEESEITTMEVEKTDIQVVKGKSEDLKVTFKDQFGTDKTAKPKVESADKDVAKVTAANNKVTVKGEKEGSTTITVTHKVGETTLKETIEVTVVEAGDLAKYEAKVDATKLDVTGNNDDKDELPKSTDVVVNEVDVNGNVTGTANNVTLVEVDKDGDKVKTEDELVTITANKKVQAAKPGTAYVQVKVGSLVIDTLEFEVVKTASYAKSVEFKRNDIVQKSSELGTLSAPITIDDAFLTDVVDAKDQYGKVMKSQPTLEFTFDVTNKTDLTVDSNDKVTKLAKAKGTADIVINKITVLGETDNLISKPVVVKLSVQADEAKAVEAINEKAADEEAVTVGNYKAAGITDVDSEKLAETNNAVAVAKTTKGKDLTKAEIQKAVNEFNAVNTEAAKFEGKTFADIEAVKAVELDDNEVQKEVEETKAPGFGGVKGAATVTLTKGKAKKVVNVTLEAEVLSAPESAKKELKVSGLTGENLKFLVYGKNGDGEAQEISTLDEVATWINDTYDVTFNKEKITVKDGTITVKDNLLGEGDWTTIKSKDTEGNKITGEDNLGKINWDTPYQITVLKTDKSSKVAKIRMYEDGTVDIVDFNNQ